MCEDISKESKLSFDEKINLVNSYEYNELRYILSDYTKSRRKYNKKIMQRVVERLWEFEIAHGG